MKPLRVLLFSLLLAAAAVGQNIPVNVQPDCVQNFNLFNQAGGTLNVQMDNRFSLCDTWIVVYMSVGYTGVTVTFQSAVDANGTPGAFGAFTGTTISGVNPLVSLTAGRLVMTGYNPWVRSNVVTIGASGTLNGTYYGYKTTANSAASGGCPSPCPVVGTANSGSPPSGAPVLVAGQDGVNVRTILTDSAGRPNVVGAGAAGAAPVGNPVLGAGTDGANAQTIRTDTSGRQMAVGPAAEGAAAASNPVLIGGTDGANARMWKVDSNRVGFVQASATGGGDATPNGQTTSMSSTVVAPLSVALYTFNGATNWDRVREAGLNSMPVSTTLTGRNSIGTQLMEKGSRWTVSSGPASGTVANASIAAEAGVRHVVDCVSFSAQSGAAVAASTLSVFVNDGATIIWQWSVSAPTAGAAGIQEVQPHSICGLNLVGTTNTAMNATFSVGVTGLFEAVSISGYNVN